MEIILSVFFVGRQLGISFALFSEKDNCFLFGPCEYYFGGICSVREKYYLKKFGWKAKELFFTEAIDVSVYEKLDLPIKLVEISKLPIRIFNHQFPDALHRGIR